MWPERGNPTSGPAAMVKNGSSFRDSRGESGPDFFWCPSDFAVFLALLLLPSTNGMGQVNFHANWGMKVWLKRLFPCE